MGLSGREDPAHLAVQRDCRKETNWRWGEGGTISTRPTRVRRRWWVKGHRSTTRPPGLTSTISAARSLSRSSRVSRAAISITRLTSAYGMRTTRQSSSTLTTSLGSCCAPQGRQLPRTTSHILCDIVGSLPSSGSSGMTCRAAQRVNALPPKRSLGGLRASR